MANTKSLESFITSWLSEKKSTVVVGGKHKGFRAKIRRNGKVVGYVPKRVSGVSNATFEVLQKMNYGGRLRASYKKHIGGSKTPMFDGATYRSTHFFEKGYANTKDEIGRIMSDKLVQMIGRQVNKVNVTSKREVS